jgi:2-phospho-L-lactate transferase/gluconeogenesis factor (CofD/UPF0052 family)
MKLAVGLGCAGLAAAAAGGAAAAWARWLARRPPVSPPPTPLWPPSGMLPPRHREKPPRKSPPRQYSPLDPHGGFADPTDPTAYGPPLVLFSGGSAFDTTVTEVAKFTARTAYVVPISDNGGSSKEIIRFLGGPAIGDIRSRLIRLSHPRTAEDEAAITLLGHRLTAESREAAKTEFLRIVDGTHTMWGGIAEAYKQTVRAFLLNFMLHTLRKESVQELSVDVVNLTDELATHFDYRKGSIGNYVITGARLFFGSFEAAIFWFSNLAGIPRSSAVVPVINVNSKVTLGVRLRSGQEIIGQDNISHPVSTGADETKANANAPLPSAIERVFYVSEYGSEVRPPVNPVVLDHLQGCHGVIYTMGSLYTSILPSLVLKGVGQAIAAVECPKILILNGCQDRETMWVSPDGSTGALMALDVVMAVVGALNQNEDPDDAAHPPHRYITHVLYLQSSPVVDEDQVRQIHGLGLAPMEVPRDDRKTHHYNDRMLVKAIRSCLEGWEVRQMCELKRRSFNSGSGFGPPLCMPPLVPSPAVSPKPNPTATPPGGGSSNGSSATASRPPSGSLTPLTLPVL